MNVLLFLGLAASGASVYLEDTTVLIGTVPVLANYLELSAGILLLAEIVARIVEAGRKSAFFRKSLGAVLSGVVVLAALLLGKFVQFSVFGLHLGRNAVLLIVLRNMVFLFLSGRKVKRLIDFLGYLRDHPAQTIILSFLMVIVSGTVLLMMPFTSSSGRGLSFVDALFTAISAVCVTGLTVVDTATAFSFAGRLIIMLLIQIGGLGIMILTFFTIFVLRRSVSIENKLFISYLLSEQDMTQLRTMVLKIISLTFGIEAVGSAFLFVGFAKIYGYGGKALFYAVFHSISAFCNAGFSLFTDSLERFVGNPLISGTIIGLIILGGASFVVLINVGRNLSDRITNVFKSNRRRVRKLTLNSRIVLIGTTLLIGIGTLLLYGTEHGNALKNYPLGTQYLAALFQSVTLRTAGFNTIPFGSLRNATYLIMIAFMFVGGASGSTAGGIKVGTVAVIYAFLSSFFRGRNNTVLFQQSISTVQVLRAFTILVFGLVVVGVAATVLSLSEHEPALKVLFETTSAFGTVGLSPGITTSLTVFGRLVVGLLMFTGRIGPLTVLAAVSQDRQHGRIEFPAGEVSIG